MREILKPSDGYTGLIAKEIKLILYKVSDDKDLTAMHYEIICRN